MKITSIQVGPIMTNCYLLRDETAGVCALIDPGDDAARVARLVEQSGCTLQYILLTHGHFDHTSAVRPLLEQYPDVPVYIHEKDAVDTERGELLFGNVDSWLIWNLTGGRAHVSDYSNCSRTMLFDIDNLCWDEELCARLGVPMSMLPTPVPSSMVYGQVTAGLPGLETLEGIPVCGSAGDQAAALLGQACIVPGQAKNTYGTGCFTLMNTGSKSVRSVSGLVTSVAWSVNGKTTYALEGSVFNAGSSIQWLRDELGLIGTAHECDILAESVPDNGGVYLVSAFTGLGAPRWDMYARGAIVGLTRGSNKAHIARATLEGIAYQVKDLLDAMQVDAESPISVLRVDGGASVSSFLMQFQADMLRVPIDRPKLVETTAFGAAFLAGIASGVWESVDDIALLRQSDRIFKPEMDAEQAKQYHDNWLRAVGRAEKWSQE